MTLYKERFRAESSRLHDWDYTARGWYFVTICTYRHRCWFGRAMPSKIELSELGDIAFEHWSRIPSHYQNVRLDDFVVMPNHVHGIIVLEGRHEYSPGTPDVPHLTTAFEPPRSGSLSAIVRSYKSGVSRMAAQSCFFGFAWQPRFYDRVLRNEREVIAARSYIARNPTKWFEDKYFAIPDVET